MGVVCDEDTRHTAQAQHNRRIIPQRERQTVLAALMESSAWPGANAVFAIRSAGLAVPKQQRAAGSSQAFACYLLGLLSSPHAPLMSELTAVFCSGGLATGTLKEVPMSLPIFLVGELIALMRH